MDARKADLDARIDPDPFRMDLDTRILFLHRAGQGPGAIAKTLGVSRMTVWRKLKAAGLSEAAAKRP